MAADQAMRERVLALVPQQPPFRFIDEILEMDETSIRGRYRFRPEEDFYRGHFPGMPITPGVILVEAMAQTGVVAFGLYLTLLAGREKAGELVTLFALADQVVFSGIVLPGDEVIVSGRKVYFRGSQLKVEVTMTRPDGQEVCSGVLAGRGIERAQFDGQMARGGASQNEEGTKG